jgi:L-arabinose isomerase
MPIIQKEFTIGLLVTALLEDKYNKTGHIREEARRAAGRYAEKLKSFGRVVHPGFFEYEPEAVKAARALKAEEVDVVVVVELAYQKGLIPLRALLEIGSDVPLIVWNSQLVDEFPESADFDLIMLNSGMAGLPELASGLARAGRRFWLATGAVDDPAALERLGELLAAARAASRLGNAKVGIIGHPYEGMTDLMQDDFEVLQSFGATCWPIDHDEVTSAFGGIGEQAAKKLIQQQKDLGRRIEVEEPMMLRSARLALALEQVVRDGGYDAVAEFDQVWLSEEKIGVIPFFGTSRMVEAHVPFTCEADVLRALCMLALEELAGHSTFLEHYILDYRRELMFNSHDGHGNPSLADPRQPVRIVPTIYYKGVHGFGASFNYAYRPGEVTLASIGSLGGGKFQFICSEGKFLHMKPRDIAAPQTLFQWDGGGIVAFSEAWLRASPSHHHTAAYGRLNRKIALTAEMLGMAHVQV